MEENSKNLDFVRKMMDCAGIGRPELAELMGTTQQNIYMFLKRDNMKLSYVQEIAQRLGYNLTFTLKKEDFNSDDVVFNVGLIVGQKGVQRLAFLRVALTMNQIDYFMVAEKLGLNYSGVNKWFKVDDLAVGYLFQIAQAFGFDFQISMKPLKKRGKVVRLY